MRKFFLVLIILISIQGFAQDNTQIEELTKSISESNYKIEQLEKELSELNEVQKNLIQKINISSDIISYQNETINRYISFLGIMLAIIGIAIPLISYIFVILPIRKNNKWFKKRYKKFELELFEESLEKAFNDLSSKNIYIRNQGYKFIYENRDRDFSNKHWKKIYNLEIKSPYDNIRELCKNIRETDKLKEEDNP